MFDVAALMSRLAQSDVLTRMLDRIYIYVHIAVKSLVVCGLQDNVGFTKSGCWSDSQKRNLEAATPTSTGHAQTLSTMPADAVMVVSRHRGERTLGKVLIIHPDVFSWQVGGDLVLVPSLSF